MNMKSKKLLGKDHLEKLKEQQEGMLSLKGEKYSLPTML